MPPGIWNSISNASYKQDKGDKLYRRGIYTYWRRTVPPPTMMTFNAAAREICTVRNDLTTTPLQALTMMNNKTFVEAARFLAERMMQAKGQRAQDPARLPGQRPKGLRALCRGTMGPWAPCAPHSRAGALLQLSVILLLLPPRIAQPLLQQMS